MGGFVTIILTNGGSEPTGDKNRTKNGSIHVTERLILPAKRLFGIITGSNRVALYLIAFILNFLNDLASYPAKGQIAIELQNNVLQI